MNLTELKREHFPNGHSFSQESLDQYIAARKQVHKDFLTRYVGSLAIGMVIGFLLLILLPSGMLRIFLSMLAVMIAAMIGTRLTGKNMEKLREATLKVNITRKDIRAAKKNLKNGTVAWSEQDKIEE